MRLIKRLDLSRESYILLAICMMDLLATIWLVGTQRATEGNPIMEFYLHKGTGMLVAMKVTLVAMPLFIAEWCRRQRPEFVRRMLRLTIAVYLGIYMIAFVGKGISASDRISLVSPNASIQHYGYRSGAD